MTGSPAGPTVAPMGRVDAAASVAGAATAVEVSDEAVEDDESALVAELSELDGSDGGGGVAGSAALESPDCERSMAWNCTPELVAMRWSCTSKLACSLSAGTALPSTTRRR